MEKKQVFAKIIELKDHQVLVVKEYSDEDDSYKVTQTSEFNGIRMSLGMGYEKKKDCDNCFTDYDNEKAEMFVNTAKEYLSQYRYAVKTERRNDAAQCSQS